MVGKSSKPLLAADVHEAGKKKRKKARLFGDGESRREPRITTCTWLTAPQVMASDHRQR